MATLVLHGPPGVGKTETGLILAEALLGSRDAVRRIDCAEFQADHDTARLTGAPPGYIGYEDGGVLSDALQETAAVIVLDEFDRGPPRLAEMLLGILDAGRLTDGRGRTATFENALLILTTNAGSDESVRLKSNLDDAPSTEDLLLAGETNLEKQVKERWLEDPEREGELPTMRGLGSPALWSRIQTSLVGYDILRRKAFDEIVANACRHLETNLGDEYNLRLGFADQDFAPVVFRHLPERWDGRRISPLIQQYIEIPVREELKRIADEALAGSELRFVPDEESGRARIQ
jgi:ATP-dependent Clp protease ATP-binding subunit ClpA